MPTRISAGVGYFTKSDHLQACIETHHCSIAVAGSRSATLAVYQLYMGLLLCKAHALGLCKATPTFSKHMPVNLLEPHIVLYSTPTNPSLYLLVIAGICIATYLQHEILMCTSVLAV